MHLQAPTSQAFGCEVRCTYAGAPRLQVHLEGHAGTQIATAPIGAPAVAAACVRADICMEGCTPANICICAGAGAGGLFLAFHAGGSREQVQYLHSTRCTCIGAPTSHAGPVYEHLNRTAG